MRKAVVVGWEGRVGISQVVCQWLPLAFGGDAPGGVAAAGTKEGQRRTGFDTGSLAIERGLAQNNKRDANQQGKSRRGDEPWRR